MTGELKTIDPKTAQSWFEQEKAQIFDIRETDEYAREHIPGAHLVPLSSFDSAEFPHDRSKIAVFHCGSGQRTAEAAAAILSSGWAEVYQLEAGLAGWKKAGLPTNLDRSAPISIQRQVQITAGSLILLGVLLAWLLSPWFVLLSGFVGAGLVFAGLSGTCAMANLLAWLPYNRRGPGGTKQGTQPASA